MCELRHNVDGLPKTTLYATLTGKTTSWISLNYSLPCYTVTFWMLSLGTMLSLCVFQLDRRLVWDKWCKGPWCEVNGTKFTLSLPATETDASPPIPALRFHISLHQLSSPSLWPQVYTDSSNGLLSCFLNVHGAWGFVFGWHNYRTAKDVPPCWKP